MKKIFRLLILLNFKILKPDNILIYGSQNTNEIKKIIKKKPYILDLNKEINFFVLIKMLINLRFKKQDYINFFIKKINPKLILSSADNDINVYNIKEYFPNIYVLLIQNGRRGGLIDIFNREFSKITHKKKIDYFFVFGEGIKKKYSEFVDAKYFCCGSIKNNFYKIVNKKNLKNKVMFISQFRHTQSDYKFKKKVYNYDEIYKNEKKLIFELYKFCKLRDIDLYILPSQIKSSKYFKDEIKSFEQNKINLKDIKILIKNNRHDSYKYLNNFNIIFGLDSTLLYECIPRNKKVASFSRFKNISNYSFAWPINQKKRGFFFSNIINQNEIRRIYDNLSKISKNRWINHSQKLKKELMSFDYRNKKLTKLIKDLV